MIELATALQTARHALLGLLSRLDRDDASAEWLDHDWQQVAQTTDHVLELVNYLATQPEDTRREYAKAIADLAALHALVQARARQVHELTGDRIRRVRAVRARLAPLVQPTETGERVDLAG